MKRKQVSFDDFKRNQLTTEGQKSIKGGLPPNGLPPEFEDEEETEPQWGGPIVLANTGGIRGSDSTSSGIKVIIP
ncbi:hypothetical protein [Flavobacterium humi]|uniref:Uncharacterized protein n=1 Tax=Flavobacterium humi TaxID=2562683 RepID=A0A4Z0L9I0_9FLAO|nr:hypothetical protein [Flavobacterium humi]TGD57653.1 hypothetical protein E4635_10725 [Flavobacterium humi]